MSKETYTHIKREKENKSLLELLDIVMYGNEHKRAIGEVNQAYEDLKQALKPPTAEEVCKALSEYLGETLWFDEDKNIRVSTQWVVKRLGDIGLEFFYVLPPHLITLIGRFYESKMKDNE